VAAHLPILMFHSLDEQDSVDSLRPRVFRHGMARLHEAGYRTLHLADAAECVRRGTPFPDRSFAITFDDGYRTVHDEALPVLQRYGMSATVFLTIGDRTTAGADRRLPPRRERPMLSWHQIRELHRCGFDFGAHTLTHPDLTRLPPGHVEAEVCDSRSLIEDALGAPVSCFAYPYGRYDDRIRDFVRQRFAYACSDRLGLVSRDSDLYALERVDAAYLRRDPLFRLASTRLFPWYIRARAIPARLKRAVRRRPPP
jgi:peptidoglycan/xylan/chitin deacetylase (PgdA/CDA1 family)